MKIEITSDKALSPDDLKKIIQHVAKKDKEHICKSDKEPRPIDLIVLREAVHKSGIIAEKIRKRMLKKLEQTVKKAK